MGYIIIGLKMEFNKLNIHVFGTSTNKEPFRSADEALRAKIVLMDIHNHLDFSILEIRGDY